jgi:hypothetical protein
VGNLHALLCAFRNDVQNATSEPVEPTDGPLDDSIWESFRSAYVRWLRLVVGIDRRHVVETQRFVVGGTGGQHEGRRKLICTQGRAKWVLVDLSC